MDIRISECLTKDETEQADLQSIPDFHTDQVEQLAFELAFELEGAELSANDLVTVNRDKLRSISARILSRISANNSGKAA